MRILICLLSLIVPSAALAGTSQPYGNGGWFEQFQPIIDQHNRNGELFRITGHCQSACTLFLGIRNVCIERSAELLFHAGHDRQRNITGKATNRLLAAYKPSLRQYVTANHYMDTLAFHTISGADMIDRFGYKECPRG